MKALYEESPSWLRALMDARADGLNYYLHTHPDVMPRVIRRFEPWMPLAFSEGSITNDITRIPLGWIECFYGGDDVAVAPGPGEAGRPGPDGSNAIPIAPSKTTDGHGLLLINPHTLVPPSQRSFAPERAYWITSLRTSSRRSNPRASGPDVAAYARASGSRTHLAVTTT